MWRAPDVAVVGGGIIGLSIAWRLAVQGARVTVYDSGSLASQASWAAAGMLAPGGEIESENGWSQFALKSLQSYPKFIAELYAVSSAPIEFRRCGAYQIAFTDGEATELKRRASQQAELGIRSEAANPKDIPGLSPDAVVARFYPDDCVINPRSLTVALIRACTARQVIFRENCAIRSIEAGYPATYSVLAAGAWSDQIEVCGAQPPPVFPVRGHLIGLREVPFPGDSIVRHGHTYVLRRNDGGLVGGSSTEHAGFNREIELGVLSDLSNRVSRLFPSLKDRNFTGWNGLRPATHDGSPVIQRVPKTNAWLAYGHYRNGVLLAPATADRVAGEIMQASSQTDSFSPTERRRSNPARDSAA